MWHQKATVMIWAMSGPERHTLCRFRWSRACRVPPPLTAWGEAKSLTSPPTSSVAALLTFPVECIREYNLSDMILLYYSERNNYTRLQVTSPTQAWKLLRLSMMKYTFLTPGKRWNIQKWGLKHQNRAEGARKFWFFYYVGKIRPIFKKSDPNFPV